MLCRITALGAVLLLAGPALAQECTSQTPPNPNMAPSQPCNSLLSGGSTARYRTFGGNLATTQVGPAVEGRPISPEAGLTRPITPRNGPALRRIE